MKSVADSMTEMEEIILNLRNQLNEANNIIVMADWDCDEALQSKCGFSKYLKKYNIERIGGLK